MNHVAKAITTRTPTAIEMPYHMGLGEWSTARPANVPGGGAWADTSFDKAPSVASFA